MIVMRPVGEQLDTSILEVVYDYPELEVNPATLVVLEENLAYIECNRVALSFNLQGNEAYTAEVNSPSLNT